MAIACEEVVVVKLARFFLNVDIATLIERIQRV